MMRKLLLSLALVFGLTQAWSQEIRSSVTINTPKLQTADPKVFKSLKTALEEFVNNRKWTDQEYEPEERIEMNIILTVDEEISQTSFKAQLTVQASRPVYKSGYNSVLFQYLDKDFYFNYGEFEVLDFTEGSFSSNLTSTIAFYAYIVLGMDHDSFEELGGEKYLNKAQDILNAVPRGTAKGWTVNDGNQSRYWLIENLLNVRVKPMRRAMYKYYLLGLDRLSQEDSRAEGIKAMEEALVSIKAVNAAYPSMLLMQIFTNSKREEILNVFEVADFRTKRKIYDCMVKLDGTHASDYQVLTQP